jgi:hypothetical protein
VLVPCLLEELEHVDDDDMRVVLIRHRVEQMQCSEADRKVGVLEAVEDCRLEFVGEVWERG